MRASLETLVTGVVDYAGLFPPAALDMPPALEAYARYRHDPARSMLGRFVVPVARLREFDDAAAPHLPRGEQGGEWQLSALVGVDASADVDLALRFNCRHFSGSEIGNAVIDALEFRVSTSVEIEALMSRMPAQFAPYFEIPIADDPAPLVEALAASGGRAKARTGGITADAFPQPGQLVRFIMRCRHARVPFKLTAGLHHPLRGSYRLTYAGGAPCGTMYGYLNALVASVLAYADAPSSIVQQALLAETPAAFTFRDDGLTFADVAVPLATIAAARTSFVHSFGSCSFREPVDELASLLNS